jgi:hypothetical protein
MGFEKHEPFYNGYIPGNIGIVQRMSGFIIAAI